MSVANGVEPETAVLVISCPDQRGIVAAVAGFLAEHGANILDASQHSDLSDGSFFMRVQFELAGMSLSRDQLAPAFAEVARRFGMSWRLRFSDDVKTMAILVSREEHCLVDLLLRLRSGEIAARLALIASNHDTLSRVAAAFAVPFHHLPLTPETKPEQEHRLLALLQAQGVDLVVLARYMQVLSPALLARYPSAVINIHHGFLPAFAGARPYHQAFARGVKLIGATSHYATEDLDAGPIIEQDTVRVSHRDTVGDLVRKGRDLERLVLARAVRAHVEDRVLVYGRRTVVFD